MRFVHATAIVIGECGVLILGEPGAGKSALAEKMMAEAAAAGSFTRLIGDDRVGLREVGERLLASPHPAIAGKIERRGSGIANLSFLEMVRINAVVQLERNPPRMPEELDESIEFEGVVLPKLVLRHDQDLAGKAHLALDWLKA